MTDLKNEIIFKNGLELVDHLYVEDTLLLNMRKNALDNHIPVISTNVASFLNLIVQIHKPLNILELGTAIGVSTLTISNALKTNFMIDTFEINAERYRSSRVNFDKSEYRNNIRSYHNDFRSAFFLEFLKSNKNKYDFIFVDAAKGQYMHVMNTVEPYLNVGGLIVFDNIFNNSWVLDLNYQKHRNKTAVFRLREFIDRIFDSEIFNATIIPVDDGIAVLVKK